ANTPAVADGPLRYGLAPDRRSRTDPRWAGRLRCSHLLGGHSISQSGAGHECDCVARRRRLIISAVPTATSATTLLAPITANKRRVVDRCSSGPGGRLAAWDCDGHSPVTRAVSATGGSERPKDHTVQSSRS